MSTQWAAQFLVAAELERGGFVVSFTMGHSTPYADLMVGHPTTGAQYWVDVKGLAKPNAWLGLPKKPLPNLFYILVLVGRVREKDRYFILKQTEWNTLIEDYMKAHPLQKKFGGFNWTDPHQYENRWDKLPGWQS